jgi:hypothetical protein
MLAIDSDSRARMTISIDSASYATGVVAESTTGVLVGSPNQASSGMTTQPTGIHPSGKNAVSVPAATRMTTCSASSTRPRVSRTFRACLCSDSHVRESLVRTASERRLDCSMTHHQWTCTYSSCRTPIAAHIRVSTSRLGTRTR